MSEPNKAIFLSYASQDADAVSRIAESLRAAGVEVWFDKNELVGGDAWDQKIRRQIKECALFVPVISAATQARREGYFRIEWKLAAQRTHAIAEGTPFLLPIALDGVPQAQALVPSEFQEVQWTALSAAQTLAPFGARVKHLTDGSPAVADTIRRAGDADHAGTPAKLRKSRVPLVVGAFVVVALGIALAFVGGRQRPSPTGTTTTLAKSTDRTRTAELAQRSTIETRDVLDVVVERARREAEASPESAGAWSKRARLEAQYIVRGWDPSDQRRQDIQGHAKRALASDPASVDAMFALAIVFLHQGAFAEAESLMRKATAREPNDAELRQALGTALDGEGREAEALEFRKETLRLFPNNPFAHYDLALSYEHASPPDLAAALRKFDDAIALLPSTSTVLHKASLLAGWKGDFPAAQLLLDTLDPVERTGDRAVGISMTIALLEHQPDRVINAAGLTAGTYFEDDYVRGPKAWLLAHAYTQAGKPSLALAQWREAEAILRQRLRANPESWFDQAGLAITLAWLGEQPEAASIMARVESVARESTKPLQSVYLAYFYAGCGDAAKAASYLRPVLERRELITGRTLPLDPWWDKVRAASPFAALLSKSENAGGTSAFSAPDPKSVAVLAFANLSDDKANEYFSDGLSEELSTVLGRVPGLRVAGSTSAFSFKGKAVPLPEIARQLGVAHIVEGTVRREGTTVRITAKLINAADGFPVWISENFNREVKSSLAVQEEIAGLIAKALSLKLGVTSPAATAEVDPRAFELYLQGREAWNRRTAVDMDRAEELFNRALAIAPRFARAHAALADVWNVRGQPRGTVGRFEVREGAELVRIVAKAREALAIDPDSAEARAALGSALLQQWKFPDAERELRRAIELNPNYAAAYQILGRLRASLGFMDEALAALKRGAELDPLAARIVSNYAIMLIGAGNLNEGIIAADRALAVKPDEFQAVLNKANALTLLGRGDEAAALCRAISPEEAGLRMMQVVVLAHAGQTSEAEARLAALGLSRGPTRFRALLALGRRQDAIATLEAGPITVNSAEGLIFSSEYDPVRDEPRFVAMLSELGLSEAHARAKAWRSAHPLQKAGAKK